MLEKLKSAIHLNVVTGLKGIDINNSFTLEQVEDSIMTQRLELIKEYSKKDLLPAKDLFLNIKCLPVDCKNISGCCGGEENELTTQHVEVPQIVNDYGSKSINFLGSVDRELDFIIYTDNSYKNHKYRKRGRNKPYVWIDSAPNENNMNDIFIFNAPMLKTLTISAIFKDLRQLELFSCCSQEEIYNLSFLDRELEDRVTMKFLRYYRQFSTISTPNDQTVKP